MAQGGDFLNHNGTGSASIYGPSFADENFLLSHSQRGTLSMANSGVNTNGCQFFITFKPTAHLDGVHVVFGYVDWRDDEESAAVLDKLERVRTDRRNDRPLDEVKIVECGIIDERKSSVTSHELGEGSKLVGEAKKNKLLQAYGEVNHAVTSEAAADDDEIDLDDDEDDDDIESEDQQVDNSSAKVVANDADKDENDEPIVADDRDQHQDDSEVANHDGPPGKLSKKAALQKRLAALRTKINQSRTLNRREVHAEASRLGTEEASMQERKRQNKQDRITKQKEYDTFVVGKLCDAGEVSTAVMEGRGGGGQKKLASLSQPASDSIWEMNERADKQERSQHGPNDYYNPEGQYANYERNLKSVRHVAHRKGETTTLDSYDPTLNNHPNNNSNKPSTMSEREGAKRLANEMKRRAEKKANQKRKLEFDAVDVTSINERNKKFNQKIGRNFDKHTAEIRQNLERGTAL
jgi:cyclophilin family peptidyl-prolyl cis-trans isomerase